MRSSQLPWEFLLQQLSNPSAGMECRSVWVDVVPACLSAIRIEQLDHTHGVQRQPHVRLIRPPEVDRRPGTALEDPAFRSASP